jgi:hypothetical protein
VGDGGGSAASSGGVHEHVLQDDEDVWQGEAGHSCVEGEGLEEGPATGEGADQDDDGVVPGADGVSGWVEKSYKKLNGEYEKAADSAQKLHNRIDSIDQVSNDLFKEWQKEIDGMENKKLKAQSAVMLRQSRLNEANYVKSMRQTEARMTPVITAFHDQVTFLKHNLNARAIGSLKGTSVKMSTDVDVLMVSLDGSMAQADALINSLNADQS